MICQLNLKTDHQVDHQIDHTDTRCLLGNGRGRAHVQLVRQGRKGEIMTLEDYHDCNNQTDDE